MDELLWKCWLDLQATRKSKMAEAIKHFAFVNNIVNNEHYRVKIIVHRDVILIPEDQNKDYIVFNRINLIGVDRKTPNSNILIVKATFGSVILEFTEQRSLKFTLQMLQDLMSDRSEGSGADSPPLTSSSSSSSD